MSSTPFRTAFWALGLALGMTLLLAIPSPQQIKLALRSQQNGQKLPNGHFLAKLFGSNKTATAPGQIARVEPTSPAIPATESVPSSPAPTPPATTTAVPVRVAANDPYFPLGMPAAQERVASIPAPMPRDPQPRNIPVPEPVDLTQIPGSVTRAELFDVKQELLRLQLAMLQRELQDTRRGVNSSAELTEEPGAPVTAAGETRISRSASSQNVSRKEAEVVPGSNPKLRTFKFDAAPLPLVLKTIGTEAGWQVVIPDQVTGVYTGELTDADPQQAFAVMLLLHNLEGRRRGHYMLVSPRK